MLKQQNLNESIHAPPGVSHKYFEQCCGLGVGKIYEDFWANRRINWPA
jgi:hypothetical protein